MQQQLVRTVLQSIPPKRGEKNRISKERCSFVSAFFFSPLFFFLKHVCSTIHEGSANRLTLVIFFFLQKGKKAMVSVCLFFFFFLQQQKQTTKKNVRKQNHNSISGNIIKKGLTQFRPTGKFTVVFLRYCHDRFIFFTFQFSKKFTFSFTMLAYSVCVVLS